ncbi:copper resistance CopC family protein [Nocardiopsis gilva]|uniref:copper resistance CopC family protein n=1 Tax=Nocardiopsis gilva TaxID=280236 RepID=UPI000347987F|nr:copper resistance CopC family protein [Nocardiopsis gilva]
MPHTFTARRSAVTLASLTASLLLGIGLAPAALAHNALIDSSPKDGAKLDKAPEEVTLTFNADVNDGGNAIVVTGPDGDTYEEGDVRLDGPTAATDLRPLDAAGEYTIAYRIVSADGHPLEEKLTFSVSEEAVADNEAAAEDADTAAPSPDDTAGSDTQDGTSTDEGEPAASSDPMQSLGPVGAVIGESRSSR